MSTNAARDEAIQIEAQEDLYFLLGTCLKSAVGTNGCKTGTT